MNKAFIGAGIALGLALAGCNTAQGVFPVGIPTVVLSVKDFKYGPGTGTTPSYQISGTLEARTQKGSTAGTIVAFKTGATELFGGPFVEACPVTSDKECGPFATAYTLTYSADPGSLKITSVIVQALNGISSEIKLAAPVVLR